MRVRTFELRLIATTLTGLWALTAGLVLVGYRPGGPMDLLVGVVACLPVAIAVAGLVWPPAARGDRAFAGIVWLGLGAGLLLVPSIGGVLNQLVARGPQTLMPSLETAYPWILALGATSLFAGLGIARRLLGGTAVRRARLLRGLAIATFATAAVSLLFAATAIANEVALHDRPATASRFGPTDASVDPPLCDRRIDAGRYARLVETFEGDVDRRSIGSASLVGVRDRQDVRWSADVATDRALGRYGIARVGGAAWTLEPRGAWREVPPSDIESEDVDLQVLATALRSTNLVAAEERGLEFVEGARARHCRLAVDGTGFAAAFPQVRWLAGDADLHRWRGEIDYWVFADGELGRVEGSIGGEAGTLGLDGLQGTLRATLIAVDRDVPVTVVGPSR
jgi:hypothetical protein